MKADQWLTRSLWTQKSGRMATLKQFLVFNKNLVVIFFLKYSKIIFGVLMSLSCAFHLFLVFMNLIKYIFIIFLLLQSTGDDFQGAAFWGPDLPLYQTVRRRCMIDPLQVTCNWTE
jgi:hypothetical protein